MCRVSNPIMNVTTSQTTSIAVFEGRLLRGAMLRNACLDGSQYRDLSQLEREHELDGVNCGRRTVVPNLDGIEGSWPVFNDDEADDS